MNTVNTNIEFLALNHNMITPFTCPLVTYRLISSGHPWTDEYNDFRSERSYISSCQKSVETTFGEGFLLATDIIVVFWKGL